MYVDHNDGVGVDYITNHLLTAGDLDVQVAPLVHQQFTCCTLESLSAKAPHSVCAESADCLLRLQEGELGGSKGRYQRRSKGGVRRSNEHIKGWS